MEEQLEIPEFYRERSILITGCTGFIGKSLIWKLLNSCPSMKNIYILIRNRHGKNISERKEELFSSPIFDNFRKSNPDIFEKVIAIEGDVSEENVGISEKDKLFLLNEVSIIFHNAAMLKMDATLTQAINVNTKGVIRMLNLALEMKKLEAFIHVSTAYCCCNENIVEEKLYSIPGDPLDIIRSVDWLPAHILEQITAELIAPLPNTYTYSKRLTELVLKTYDDKLPIIIARPTIVFGSIHDPFPGWMDKFNGAAGVAVCAGKGILHSFFGNLDSKGDLVPVDIVCNSLIAMPWAEVNKKKLHLNKSKISVYNVALTECDQITWGDYQDVCKKGILVYPYETILWYPTFNPIQENEFLHKLENIFYHTIPAYVIDNILYLLGKKPFLVKIQQKISQGMKLLSYFSRQQWTFQTDNIMMLKNFMNDADKKVFPVTEKGLDFEFLIRESARSSKKNYFKENMDNIAWCKTKLKIFLAIKIIAKLFLYYIFLKFVWTIFYFMYHIFTS